MHPQSTLGAKQASKVNDK